MVIADYVIIGAFIVGLVLGLWKGLFKQVFALAGIFVIGLGTSMLSPYPASWLASVIESDTIRNIVALVVTAAVISAVYGLVVKLLSKIINKIPILGWLNRLLGAVFSIAVVYLILAVLVAIVLQGEEESMFVSLRPYLEDSWFVEKLYGGADASKNFFGNWLVNMFWEKIGDLIPAV